jgi:hypothetical protein
MHDKELIDAEGKIAVDKAVQLIVKSIGTKTNLQQQLFKDTLKNQNGRELLKGLLIVLSTFKNAKNVPFQRRLIILKKLSETSVSRGEQTEKDAHSLYNLFQAVEKDKETFETALVSMEDDPAVLQPMLYNLVALYMILCDNHIFQARMLAKQYQLLVRSFAKTVAKYAPIVKMQQENFSKRIQAEKDSTELALNFIELVAHFDKAKDDLESIPVFDSDELFYSEKVMNFIETENQEELLRGLCNIVSVVVINIISHQPLAIYYKWVKKRIVRKAQTLLIDRISTTEGLACAFDLLITLTEKDTFFRKSESRFNRKLETLNDKPDIIFALIGFLFYLLALGNVNTQTAINDLREEANITR